MGLHAFFQFSSQHRSLPTDPEYLSQFVTISIQRNLPCGFCFLQATSKPSLPVFKNSLELLTKNLWQVSHFLPQIANQANHA